MATQTLEFNATPGLTLTAPLFAMGSDTVVQSVSATPKTNDKGRYVAVYTNVPAGRYRLNAFVGANGGFANETYGQELITATFFPDSEQVPFTPETPERDTADNLRHTRIDIDGRRSPCRHRRAGEIAGHRADRRLRRRLGCCLRRFRHHSRRAAAIGPAIEFSGSPETIEEKVAFYRSIDALSVPTDFAEPKGLPVLEAWANGVPVVQPSVGAFPELIGAEGAGGLLVPHRDPQALADAWASLLTDRSLLFSLAQAGYHKVREQHSHAAVARVTLSALEAIR